MDVHVQHPDHAQVNLAITFMLLHGDGTIVYLLSLHQGKIHMEAVVMCRGWSCCRGNLNGVASLFLLKFLSMSIKGIGWGPGG